MQKLGLFLLKDMQKGGDNNNENENVVIFIASSTIKRQLCAILVPISRSLLSCKAGAIAFANIDPFGVLSIIILLFCAKRKMKSF